MNKPLISVLIPSFNAERYLQSTLESVLAQTHQNLEAIVVDDGSLDESCQVVGKFNDRRVRLIPQKNRGAAAARNEAFRASAGEFILFLDADDLICKKHIEALLGRLANSDKCIAMSRWDRFYSDPNECEFLDRPGYRDDDGISWLVSDWKGARGMTQPGMFLIPRPLLHEVGLWREELTLDDDFEFFARVICGSQEVRFATDAKLYYRSGLSQSLSGRRGSDAVRSSTIALTLGVRRLLDAEYSTRTKRAAANVFQNFIYRHYPHWRECRKDMAQRVKELGGSDLEPDGPPRFHHLRRVVGWRAARLTQHLAEKLGLNRASRAR